MAIHLLICPRCIGTFRFSLDHLYLSIRGWGRLFCGLVLADFWLWLLLYRTVSG